jgi:hypothetical protein
MKKAFNVVKNVQSTVRPSGAECLQICIDVALRMVPVERKQRFLDLVEAQGMHELIMEYMALMLPDDDSGDDDSDSDSESEEITLIHTLTRK